MNLYKCYFFLESGRQVDKLFLLTGIVVGEVELPVPGLSSLSGSICKSQ